MPALIGYDLRHVLCSIRTVIRPYSPALLAWTPLLLVMATRSGSQSIGQEMFDAGADAVDPALDLARPCRNSRSADPRSAARRQSAIEDVKLSYVPVDENVELVLPVDGKFLQCFVEMRSLGDRENFLSFRCVGKGAFGPTIILDVDLLVMVVIWPWLRSV